MKLGGYTLRHTSLLNISFQLGGLFEGVGFKETGLRLSDHGPLIGWQRGRTVVVFKQSRDNNHLRIRRAIKSLGLLTSVEPSNSFLDKVMQKCLQPDVNKLLLPLIYS